MKYRILLWKNIRNRVRESLLVMIGVTCAVAASYILISLRLGVGQALYEGAAAATPLSQLTVYGNVGGSFLRLLGSEKKNALSDETIEEIKKISGVAAATGHMVYGNLASVEVELFGSKLQTDSLIFGAPEEIVVDELQQKEAQSWKNFSLAEIGGKFPPLEKAVPVGTVPVVVSRQLIDFYNLSIAPGNNLPGISEKVFLGKEIHIFPGYSSFFNHGERPTKELIGKIVGFSNRVELLGITIPIHSVQALNQSEGRIEKNYSKIFVTLTSPSISESVTKELEARGFRVASLQKEYSQISQTLHVSEVILFVLSILIVGMALLLIASSIWAMLLKRTPELGLLRALGASRSLLTALLLIEIFSLALIGALIGVAVGLSTAQIFGLTLAKNLTLSSLPLNLIFSPRPTLAIALVFLGPLLATLTATPSIVRLLKNDPQLLIKK